MAEIELTADTLLVHVKGADRFFALKSERVFWDVHHPERAVALSLRDETYAKLVVEVDDPDATILAIEAALGSRRLS